VNVWRLVLVAVRKLGWAEVTGPIGPGLIVQGCTTVAKEVRTSVVIKSSKIVVVIGSLAKTAVEVVVVFKSQGKLDAFEKMPAVEFARARNALTRS
jgi:hypothetical protein